MDTDNQRETTRVKFIKACNHKYINYISKTTSKCHQFNLLHKQLLKFDHDTKSKKPEVHKPASYNNRI